MSLTLALSKGRLLAGAQALFRRAGLPFPQDEGRRLVVTLDGVRFLFVKDADVPTYVEYGTADCGIAGRDVLLESGSDVYEPLDLGFGQCRMVVAGLSGGSRRESIPALGPQGLTPLSGCAPEPPSAADYRRSSTVRVASKYPRVAAAHFRARGLSAEVVRLAGSVELAPALGLADCIVDVVETGRTLSENGLRVLEEVAACSARLVVNPASFHARRADLAGLIEQLRQARA